jgi:hypothetical protein
LTSRKSRTLFVVNDVNYDDAVNVTASDHVSGFSFFHDYCYQLTNCKSAPDRPVEHEIVSDTNTLQIINVHVGQG